MDLYEFMLRQSDSLEHKIAAFEEKLKDAPTDHLISTRSGGRTKWYAYNPETDHGHYTYLGKKDDAKTRALIKRDIYQSILDDCRKDKAAIDKYLHACSKSQGPGAYAKLLSEKPHYLQFLNADPDPLKQKIHDWLLEEYPYNPERDEYKVKAANGLMVRSKSEALIIRLFLEYDIPFRYECPLQYENITYSPDFTIMHPRTGQIILWEHLGRLDLDSYFARNVVKFTNYRKLGYYPYKNLLLTFEYKDLPFDLTIAEEMIKRYLI